MSFLIIPSDNEISTDKELSMTNGFYGLLNKINSDRSLYRHHGKRGLFYLVRLDSGKKPEVHTSSDLLLLIEHARAVPFHNWFVTMNTLRTNRRFKIRHKKDGTTYENTRVITSFYLDFDVKSNGVSMNTFRKALPGILSRCGVNPTSIIKSGHGYHVIIVLKHGVPVNSSAVSNLWEMIQGKLIDKVANECRRRFGKAIVDPSVSDITRILRTAGSYNMKKSPILVTIKYFNPNNRPSLRDMQRKWFPRYEHKNHHKKHRTSQNQTKHDKHPKHKHYKSGTLNAKRRYDLFRLANMRRHEAKYDPSPIYITHFREFALFYLAISSVTAFDNKKTTSLLFRLNNRFSKPLPKFEVKHVVNELDLIKKNVTKGRKMINNYHEKHEYTKMKSFPKGYMPTNKTIVRQLHITPKEQRNLRTLIDKHERWHRYTALLLNRQYERHEARIQRNKLRALRRHQFKMTKIRLHKTTKKIIDLRNAKIMILHGQGLSLRAIADQVNIGKSAVSNVIKQGVQSIPNNLYITSRCCTASGCTKQLCNSIRLVNGLIHDLVVKLFYIIRKYVALADGRPLAGLDDG